MDTYSYGHVSLSDDTGGSAGISLFPSAGKKLYARIHPRHNRNENWFDCAFFLRLINRFRELAEYHRQTARVDAYSGGSIIIRHRAEYHFR